MRALAPRAAKAGPYRLVEGMLIYTPDATEHYERRALRVGAHTTRRTDLGDWLPRLDDPATLGCIVHLLREAWGMDDVCLRPDSTRARSLPIDDDTKWDVLTWLVKVGERECTPGQPQGEAVVLALEEAPCASSD